MSFWQSKSWWEMLVKSKQVEKVIYLWDLLIEKRSIWLGKYGLFVLWVENIANINENELLTICKKENCVFIQVETVNSFVWIKNELTKSKHFKPGYYKKFITHYTAIIDLSKSEEDILSDMKPKWRYNIKLAEKKEIKVIEVGKTKENIEIFYKLVQETTKRDGFSWNSFDYYKTFLEAIPNSSLLIAYKDNFPVSAWTFIFDSDVSIYYYWASTNDESYRNLMAPYLLQWTAIKKAKESWSKYYDFLWVSAPWEIKSSLAWVTDFKLKFTKDIVNISDSYIWINKKFVYFVLNFLRRIKNM